MIDLTELNLVCIFFDIPSSHTEEGKNVSGLAEPNARYAIEKSEDEADKIPRNHLGKLVYPLDDVPEGKQRICFMLRPVGRTQPEVLDIDLMSIFAGVKEALDDLGEEGRTKTLPIEWRGCYVFSVERIENIETWDKSPSNIELHLLRAQVLFQIEKLGYLVDWTNLLFLLFYMLFLVRSPL